MKNNQILIKTSLQKSSPIKAKLSGNGAIGNTAYPPLTDKPRINEVVLIDNKTSEDLGLQSKMHAMTVQEVQSILYNNKGRRE